MKRLATWLLMMVLLASTALAGEPPAAVDTKAEVPPAPATEKTPEKAVEKPAAKPADAKPGAAAPLVAVVKQVQGTVETRPAVGQPWTPVQVGMHLAEGADIRTGFRARCLLDLVDSLVQVDPLTVVRIGELARQEGKVRTRIIMKQGNTQAVVEKPTIESDFAIVTPSATLSVRGTRGINAGFFPVWGGRYGLAGPGLVNVMNNNIGSQTFCRPGQNTNDNTTPPIQMLQQGFLPIILPQGGLGNQERFAAGRWHTSNPMPAGLQGAGGPPNLLGKGGSQQTDPNDTRTPLNPTGDNGRIDITEPPYEPPA